MIQPKNAITLGSAQFGMDYGLTNKKGKVEEKEAIEIIRKAILLNFEYIDTAAAYGSSEKIIGKALSSTLDNNIKIITKLIPFDEISKQQNNKIYWKSLVENSILKSFNNLNVKKIDTIMLHRASHLKNPFIIDELLRLRNKKLFKNIGVSIQSTQELEFSLKADYLSIIQIPVNILDYRWDIFIDEIKKIKQRRQLKIHARSVFLQGLLIDNKEKNWLKANVKEYLSIQDWMLKKKKDFNCKSTKSLCVRYINGLNWIDSMVIGVETLEQLNENFLLYKEKPLDQMQINLIQKERPILDINSLDPSKWKKN